MSGLKKYLTIRTSGPKDGSLPSVLQDLLPQIEEQAWLGCHWHNCDMITMIYYR